MTQELKENEIWYSGAYSATKDEFIPHFVIDEQHPKGRITIDRRQAELWAIDDAEHFNSDPQTGVTDWVPHVEPGLNIYIDDTGA